MANATCSFSSINDVLAQAAKGQLNLTTTVSSCPAICSLAWGIGNPDLSGIGANASYIFQAALTFIFGPLFCLYYYNRGKFSEEANETLEALHDTFLDASAQFSIPVAIAAVIRFRQHAPFYELAFLRSLTTMQFLSLLCTAVTAGIFEKRKSPQRIFIIVLYGVVNFGFYMGLIGGLRTSQAVWKRLTELSDACKAYSHLLPWSAYIPAPNPHLGLGNISKAQTAIESFFEIPVSASEWRIIGIIIGMVIAFVLSIFILIGLYRALKSRQLVFLAPVSLAFAIGTLVVAAQMERTRDIMRIVSGQEFQDDQWGFGQVIALFLWVPLCMQMVYYGALIGLFERQPRAAADAEAKPVTEKLKPGNSDSDQTGRLLASSAD
ncbi:hypothetical protein GALMADRAFT_138962 [Galerina marginata CBS 339.88]|uniref:Uncharacterized protein n=1 Tax=Galerina marginata (strain CBS 339.88) TaxID=685588 RepID=A0A067TAM1_GALM3|nr:hypothetical protein GALMADRAFT_138962 [Galerina marginata CBS 339.88]